MNIFWLDQDMRKCAAYACDQHIVKMITEHAQQMCTVLADFGFSDVPLRPTHQQHPCVRWLREDFANFVCLYALNDAYFEEFKLRYRHSQHSGYWRTKTYVKGITLRCVRRMYAHAGADRSEARIPDMLACPIGYITMPPMAMPKEVQIPLVGNTQRRIATVIRSYRQFYKLHKSAFARYKTGRIPSFMKSA